MAAEVIHSCLGCQRMSRVPTDRRLINAPLAARGRALPRGANRTPSQGLGDVLGVVVADGVGLVEPVGVTVALGVLDGEGVVGVSEGV
jgi:hypothetical protein